MRKYKVWLVERETSSIQVGSFLLDGSITGKIGEVEGYQSLLLEDRNIDEPFDADTTKGIYLLTDSKPYQTTRIGGHLSNTT